MSSFISQNVTEIEALTGCTFACICHTIFRMFSCLQINWQPFYLRQLLKFHPFQGTHHKIVSLQPMPSSSPRLCPRQKRRKGLIALTSMLNERTGQFYKAVLCEVMRQLKTEAQMGLKHNLTSKQVMHKQNLVHVP